jgi:predicted  nucleic acid-binding Zn-ribbon protein
MNELMQNLFNLQSLEIQLQDKVSPDHPEIRRLRRAVPEPVLGHYDRLRLRGKKGVALVRNGVCGECHMKLAIGVAATLVKGEDIQLCGSCGRYLHLAEIPVEAPVPAVAVKPAPKKRKPRAVAHAA